MFFRLQRECLHVLYVLESVECFMLNSWKKKTWLLPFLLSGQSLLYKRPWWQILVVVDTVEVFVKFVKFVTDTSSVLIQLDVKHPTLNKTITINAMQVKHPDTTSDMIFLKTKRILIYIVIYLMIFWIILWLTIDVQIRVFHTHVAVKAWIQEMDI